MAEIFLENPDYQNGWISFFGYDDADAVLPRAAEIVSEFLNKWNTNVAFISLTGLSEALKALVKTESRVARLYTVDQKNPDPNVILRKARGMVNRRFVRAVVLEGIPLSPKTVEEWGKRFKRWTLTHQVIVGVMDE